MTTTMAAKMPKIEFEPAVYALDPINKVHRKFPMREDRGILRADMGGLYGWTSVWAPDYATLLKRVRLILAGRTGTHSLMMSQGETS